MIPVLDWQQAKSDPDAFAAELGQAARGAGFFLVKNHDIPAELIAQLWAQLDAFFALPISAKEPLSLLKSGNNRGWSALGDENLDDTTDDMDQKEAFNIGLDLPADHPRMTNGEPFRGANIWPDLPEFRSVTLAYFDAVLDLGRRLHSAIARDLGLKPDYFDESFTAPLATLRLLHYPPARADGPKIGAGAHTDYGSITLLLTDGEPGLQVTPRGGEWIDVPQIPGALVVNIADCLMRWTNDIYVSTPHRVLAPKATRRSVAFFLDPNPEAVIAALPGTGEAKYPPVTGADYLRQRLEATYSAMGAA
ncbi:MAG: isopenicillin N synthase family dioxygenase [Mangrovicoccus sp.]